MDLRKVSVPHLQDVAALGPALPVTSSGPVSASPLLLVSDNPETVDAGVGGTGVLGEFRLSGLAAREITFRLFFWHLNQLGAGRDFGVTIENVGGGGVTEVVRIVRAVKSGADFLSIGKSVAEALLSGGGQIVLDASGEGGAAPLTIPAGATLLLERFAWPGGRLVGGEMEVTVRAASGSATVLPDLMVRTVCAPTGSSLPSIVTPLTAPQQTHPYGCWPFSAVTVDATFIVSSAPTQGHLRLGTGTPGAPDAVFLADAVLPNSTAPGRLDRDNRAGFGGVFGPIAVTLDNPTDTTINIRALLQPRGGTFAGAVVLPDGTVRGIPRLQALVEAADLGSLAVPARSRITVSYALAVAGAASTPVVLFFETV